MTMKELADKLFEAYKDAHDNFSGPTFLNRGGDYGDDHISFAFATDKSLRRMALLEADSLEDYIDMIEDVVVSDEDGRRYIRIKTKDM